jgi:tripartite-type tricarboxylate transporter receptor subunit TctC
LAQDFYKGKTIRFIVGYGPGGGYDNYTRLIARHIGKHIPGNPNYVVENMEGAGSLLAANYIYNRAEPDGLTVGNWNSGMVLLQALGGKGIRFDAGKFGWIGAPLKGSPVCALMAFTGPKTLDEILASKKEIKFGGTAPGAITDDGPRLMNLLIGTKFKVIAGYKGSADIRLAMRRKEVDGICITWDSMRVTARAELEAKGDDRLIPFIFHGKSKDPEVKDLPQFTKVIKGQENLAAWKAYVNPNDFQRPLMVPPKTPKDRLNILRKAYKETVEDPEFLAEAKKSKLLIDYVSGEEIEEFTREILSLPAGAKEKLKFLAEPEK